MSSCPPYDQLRQLHSGLLPDPERERVEQHVAGCETCRAVLDGLTDIPTVHQGPQHPTPAPRGPTLQDFSRPLSPGETLDFVPENGVVAARPAFEPDARRTFGDYELLE